MVTISFQVILTLVLTNWIGLTGGPDGVSNIPRPAGFHGGRAYLGLCLVLLVLAMTFAWRLKLSRLGRAMQAVRDNEIAAGTCGIDIFRTKVVAFGISAVFGGLGGALFAGAFSYISPDQFTFNESIVMLTMALLGGVQSPFGALLGTFALVILPEWLRFLRQAYLAIYGGAVILLMIFLPDGVWGFAARRLYRRPAPVAGRIAPLLLLSARAGAVDGAVLEIDGLQKHFGGLRALDGISFAVRRGSVHALIGPNGSGKTTFLNVISGLYRATAGTVRLAGAELGTLAPHRRTRRGMTRTYQNIRVFRGLTVLENVVIGAERPGNDVREAAAVVERALAALDFVGLRAEASLPVAALPYGHQRYVEIARALAGSPDILLLDEPAAGLNSTEKQELAGLLRRLKGHGLTILVIEHDMNLIEAVADHITVLNFGRPHRRREAARGAEPPGRHRRLSRRAARREPGGAGMSLLEIEGLHARYNAGEVLHGLDIAVEEGEIVALLGANGAGKTTTLRAVSGLLAHARGRISFAGQDILGRRPGAIVRAGVAHVPEGRRVFPGLTVRENILLGASNRRGLSRAARAGEVEEMLGHFPDLARLQHALGWTLSGGQLQMVAVARGLMARPKLLLLDEPSLGLAPLIVQQVFRIVADIRARGTTVLLVEQNAHMALSVADRGYVLETGRLLVSGKPDTLWSDPKVRAAYLGGLAGAA